MDNGGLYTLFCHCFVIVEEHCLDRVMCLFELHQHIFDDVDTLDDMHVVNCHDKKKKKNWLVVHAKI